MSNIIKFNGDYILKSDRNLQPPFYVYPNDFVAYAILTIKDKNNKVYEPRIESILKKRFRANHLFELRTTVSDIYAVLHAFRRQDYITNTWNNFYVTKSGIKYCENRIVDFHALKPKAEQAFFDEFEREKTNPSI